MIHDDFDTQDPTPPGYLAGHFSGEEAPGPAGGWDRLAADLAPPARPRRRAAWLWLPAALMLGLGTAGLVRLVQPEKAATNSPLAGPTASRPEATVRAADATGAGMSNESAPSNSVSVHSNDGPEGAVAPTSIAKQPRVERPAPSSALPSTTDRKNAHSGGNF